jgi:tetratricopeptide (TPR) repeat protein
MPNVHGAWLEAVICVLVFFSGACSSKTDVPTPSTASSERQAPPDRATLRPVTLPDLARVSPTVQKQLRDGFASLTAAREKAGTTDVELGRAYGEVGTLLMAAEYREAAEPGFLNAEALMPTEIRWPYYLGHLYKLRGDPADSTKSFERALQLQPDHVPTLVWLGSAYLDEGRPADAEPLLRKALSLQPKMVAVLFGLGRVALAKQEYARAIDYFDQALSLDPKAATIHYQLAMAYRGMGDLTQAEAHLRLRSPGEVRPPDPLMLELDLLLESPVAYEVRGAQALDEGKWAVAAEYFRKGAELAPNEPSLRHKMGTALAMNGQGAEAFKQFEEVTRRWPNFAKAQYSLGVMLAGVGRHREAIEHLAAAVKSEPTYVEANLQLAEALRASGHFAESLPVYDQTIKLDPRVAEAHLGYAMALAGLQRYDAARERLTEAMKIHPERREFPDMLARLPAAAAGRR